MGKKRRYDRQFKEEAVRLVTEGGREAVEVADSLGISPNLIYNWRQIYKGDNLSVCSVSEGGDSVESELRRLRHENANLKEDKEILKKALAIFSKLPK